MQDRFANECNISYIVNAALFGASRDAGFAKRLLSLPTAETWPRRFVDELVTNCVASLFDTVLRFRRTDDLKTFEWVETTAALAAGYLVEGSRQASSE
jgi:hypothetical protein